MCVPESHFEWGISFVNCRIDWDHEYKDKHNRGKYHRCKILYFNLLHKWQIGGE